MDKNKNLGDLSDALAEDLGVSKKAAREGLTKVFEQIVAATKEGGKVAIFGFGTFARKDRAARQGRNPQNGEAVSIPAKSTVSFKAAPSLAKEFKPLKKAKK